MRQCSVAVCPCVLTLIQQSTEHHTIKPIIVLHHYKIKPISIMKHHYLKHQLQHLVCKIEQRGQQGPWAPAFIIAFKKPVFTSVIMITVACLTHCLIAPLYSLFCCLERAEVKRCCNRFTLSAIDSICELGQLQKKNSFVLAKNHKFTKLFAVFMTIPCWLVFISQQKTSNWQY